MNQLELLAELQDASWLLRDAATHHFDRIAREVCARDGNEYFRGFTDGFVALPDAMIGPTVENPYNGKVSCSWVALLPGNRYAHIKAVHRLPTAWSDSERHRKGGLVVDLYVSRYNPDDWETHTRGNYVDGVQDGYRVHIAYPKQEMLLHEFHVEPALQAWVEAKANELMRLLPSPKEILLADVERHRAGAS
jgi:hypothetical protein